MSFSSLASQAALGAPLPRQWHPRPLPCLYVRQRCLRASHVVRSSDVSAPLDAAPDTAVADVADASAATPTAANSLPPDRLKQLRQAGLAMKDVIKLGRRGAAPGITSQIQRRWNTSEVARLRCEGKFAANMKLVVQDLEAATGGVVVHRAGGTLFLYRGDAWTPPLAGQQQQYQLEQEQRRQERRQQEQLEEEAAAAAAAAAEVDAT